MKDLEKTCFVLPLHKSLAFTFSIVQSLCLLCSVTRLQLLNIDPDEDEFLSRDEFGLVKEKLVNEYVASYRQQVPSCRHRNRAEAMINDGYGGDIITHIKQR